MKLLVYLFCVILLSSCASIFHQPHQYVNIHTTEPAKIVYKKDSIQTIENIATLLVPRSIEPLELTAITDSSVKTYNIESRNSAMYWANIYFNYGLGMLVDRNTPKRYSYPFRIYLNEADNKYNFYNYKPSKHTGEIDLHVSLPHINFFHLNPSGEPSKSNAGFWGISLGADYYHKSNQYLHIGAVWATDFFIPIPGAIDISGEYELMSTRYLSISNNYRIRRFSLGYGISFARNKWEFKYIDRFGPPPPTREPVKKSSNSFGLIFPAYYQLGYNFHLGVIYRPAFYRPNMNGNERFKYEHLISVDLAWKIKISGGKGYR